MARTVSCLAPSPCLSHIYLDWFNATYVSERASDTIGTHLSPMANPVAPYP